jgi:hypothetical protein
MTGKMPAKEIITFGNPVVPTERTDIFYALSERTGFTAA